MLIATESNMGERPRCIECGARAGYIELHARFTSSCDHDMDSYSTRERLSAEYENALAVLDKAYKRLIKFAQLMPTGPSISLICDECDWKGAFPPDAGYKVGDQCPEGRVGSCCGHLQQYTPPPLGEREVSRR